jgi:hypothetical protein
MKCNYMALSAVLALAGWQAQATTSILGSAESFAVLGGSAVTNTGSTTITGNLGVFPGSAMNGFPSGSVSGGAIHGSDGLSLQAQSDSTKAYNGLANMPVSGNLTGQDLGGLPCRQVQAGRAANRGTPMNNAEMARVWQEAQGIDVTVNGWQEGSKNVPGFATVTDNDTRTTFAVKHREPLADALDRLRARTAAGRRKVARQMRKHEPEGIPGGAGTANAAQMKGSEL